MLASLSEVDHLRARHEADTADAEHSFAALCERHNATLVQAWRS